MTEFVKAHISNPKGNWYARGFKPTELDALVLSVHFVCHENVDNMGFDGQPPTNHWTLALRTSPSSCVHLDMSPSDIGKPGVVILKNGNDDDAYIMPAHVKMVSCAVPPGITVAAVIKLLVDGKRDQYLFAPVGEGCRFWLSTLASDFADAGIISQEDALSVQSSLQQYWPYPQDSAPVDRPVQEGQFI